MKAEFCLWRFTVGVRALIAVVALTASSTASHAQLLYSFESGLEGWTAANATLVNSTAFGATDGARSMLIDNHTSSFKNNAGFIQLNSGPVFDILQTAATAISGGDTGVKLEFDFTYDNSGATGLPAFAQLAMFMNSSAGTKGYSTGSFIGGNIGTSFPVLQGAAVTDGVSLTSIGTNALRVAVPLDKTMTISPGTFYQMGFQTNGGWGGTVDWAIDNLRITGVDVIEYESETLFSWETPDSLATPTVNEQLERWEPGFQAGHAHSISSTGATDGSSSLNIQRTYTGAAFSWGSQFRASSDTDPGPAVVVDPVIQAQINTLAGKIETADRVAFDVTFDPSSFDASPTFTTFALHFSDTANFFDASFPTFHPLDFSGETTLTMELPISAFETSGGVNLATTGFVDNTTFLRIGIATSMDGLLVASQPVPVDFQIDNFRLLTAVGSLHGDYNADGTVDAADYVAWKKVVGTTSLLSNDPDEGTTVGPAQYATWRTNFGEVESGGGGGAPAVPEPTSGWLLIVASVAGAIFVRRQSKM